MVDSINGINYFTDTNNEISKDYDFNKDGIVDIADYNLACAYLSDEDPTNDVEFTKEKLDTTFAKLIEEENKNQKYDEITDDNVEKLAKELVKTVNSNDTTPSKAKTLHQLQDMGKILTKSIKEGAELAKILAKKIETQKNKLDDLTKQKAEKEKEYEEHAQEVSEKESELDIAVVDALRLSNKMSDYYTEKSKQVVSQCIKDYAAGKSPDKNLAELIKSTLAGVGYDTTALKKQLSNCTTLGQRIQTLCSDISSIAEGIRDITSKYNIANTAYNDNVDLRNDVLKSVQTASTKYQTGYQRRLDMRKEIINKYHVENKGDYTKSENTQVQKLAEFLNNKELDKMPLADAWNILQNTFDGVLKFGDDNQITIPKGHDNAARNIFASLAKSLKDNYNIDALTEKEADPEPDPGYVDPNAPGATNINWTDPISFTSGDVKYDFIQDKNNDGIFNDASEFLGSQNGWAEMKQFDTNGDGIIKGDELENLQLVGVNQTNGQFSFTNAKDAGIESIDLASFAENKDKKLTITNDYNQGSFKINMQDGQVIKGIETLDSEQNLNNNYGVLFGAQTVDAGEMYDENPFMENFNETVVTDDVVKNANIKIENGKAETENITETTKISVDKNAYNEANKAESEKILQDKIERDKEKKLAEKEEQAKLEAKLAEEKK